MKKILLLLTSFMFFTCNTQHVFQLTPHCKLVIEHGDITKTKSDVIVNAANEQLENGGGVCGAIFHAAGKDLLEDEFLRYKENMREENLVEENNIFCETGFAISSPSFNLAKQGIKYIIHAVGPDGRKITDDEERKLLLRLTYESIFNAIADHDEIYGNSETEYLWDSHKKKPRYSDRFMLQLNGIKTRTIALPFISGGIDQFPKQEACEIAINTVREKVLEAEQPVTEYEDGCCYLAHYDRNRTEIKFVLLEKDDWQLFVDTARKLIGKETEIL